MHIAFWSHFHSSIAPRNLLVYSDADWAGFQHTRRSILGYSVYIVNNLVSWSAKNLQTFSRSSCELECRALALVATRLI